MAINLTKCWICRRNIDAVKTEVRENNFDYDKVRYKDYFERHNDWVSSVNFLERTKVCPVCFNIISLYAAWNIIEDKEDY